jgi:hypothetical protein
MPITKTPFPNPMLILGILFVLTTTLCYVIVNIWQWVQLAYYLFN